MGHEEALRLIEEAKETGATELDLGDQGLTELLPEIFDLTHLTKLWLNDNLLTEIPPQIVQLSNLTSLYLNSNELAELSPELFQLTNLITLDLSFNPLIEVPAQLAQLTNLSSLSIGYTNLTELPSMLFQLLNLTGLYFPGNHLFSLPPQVSHLINLKRLYLSDNQLSSLPSEIVQLSKLKWVAIDNNPLISPPYELAVQGMDAIREYFASAEEGTRTVAEVKVILVGEGASGKTSLTRCLREERFNEHEETTHGIRIKPWQLETGDQSLRCNLWDFGGQEIMHATHQFFLSRRSLYVLVLDGRRDERPEYWLRLLKIFGGGSPVLVVLNKYDINPSFDLDRSFLKNEYPFIKGYYRTSCKTGQGVGYLKKALKEELATLSDLQ